ncbi:MAG: hypothetical protein JNJ45_00405 [Chthonomonas sp.]|nr:hypothetical protein [Chthonomonas sp.]
MKNFLILLVAALFALVGCGGGGGGASTNFAVTGTVIWLPSNDVPNPAATTQIGSRAVLTSLVDGSFVQSAPAGTASMQVSHVPAGGAPVAFTFRFPAIAANVDLGQLVLGPEKVIVRGRILAADTGSPISGARVFFGGQFATTNSAGEFSVLDVGYSSSALANFLTISGRVTATSYLPVTFGASSGATAGVVNVGDIQLPPTSSDTPPTLPGNLFGTINPSASGAGTVVQVLNGSGTAIRQFTTGSDRKFAFWLSAGTYTLRATNGALSSGDVSVTVTSVDVPVTRDLTLN